MELCIKLSPNKIAAVSKFAEPKNVRQIQSFLGITPLSDHLKKDIKFYFRQSEINAFNKLKTLLTTD